MPKVFIRPLTIEDASISFRWRNDPEIWHYTDNRPDTFITEEIEKNWLSEKLTENNSSRFAIIAGDQYVGNIQITDIIEKSNGQYHIFIGEKSFWHKGIARQSTAQIIRFAREKLNLKELYLIVNPDHVDAIKLYENSGFVKVNDDIRMSLNLSVSRPPVVSVFVMTYNHERFIAQALEGILMQKTSFDFDIVIGEDCSTDYTRKIVLEYSDRYPGKFKLLLQGHNVGAMANQLAVLQACTGKYIAICEGDDYWTDPYKLQKQVDFLEENMEYSMCFTDFMISDEKNEIIRKSALSNSNKRDVQFSDIITLNFIPPAATIMFRKILFNASEKRELINLFGGDVLLCAVLLSKLKGSYIDIVSSCWRMHDGGVFSKKKFTEKIHFKIYDLLLLKKSYPDHSKRISNAISYNNVLLAISYLFMQKYKLFTYHFTGIFVKSTPLWIYNYMIFVYLTIKYMFLSKKRKKIILDK